MYDGKPVDRRLMKPIYLIIVSSVKNKSIPVRYFRSSDITEAPVYIELRGLEFSKEEDARSIYSDQDTLKNANEINIKIPWHNVLSVENLTYKNKSENKSENGK